MNHELMFLMINYITAKNNTPMKIKLALLTTALALTTAQVYAQTLYMGPGQTYSSMEEVQEVIQEGDVLEIAPGTYRDCASFDVDNITIRPKGWPNHEGKVRFQDVSCEGKGIFVIVGDNIRVDAIEFINAKVPDLNGSGIRFNGKRLFVYDSYFYNNEVGIMTGDNPDADIVVSRSVFESNGKVPPRWGHGLYVNEGKRLKVTDSLFIKQKTGHHIKSRAMYTEVIGNEIADGMDGNASYAIDIANGGSVLIENNVIQKGPLSDNITTVICVACEGGTNPGEKIIVRNNTFTNDTSSNKVVFLRNLTSNKEEVTNNKFKGNDVVLISNDFAS